MQSTRIFIFMIRKFNSLALVKYFRKYKIHFVIAVTSLLLVFFLLNNGDNIEAATFGWLQATWSGGASTVATANHTANQSGWSLFFSKSPKLNTENDELNVATSSGAVRTQTSDTDFNQGVSVNAYVASGKVIMKKPLNATCSNDIDCATNYCEGSPKTCKVPPVECDGSNGVFTCGNICIYKGDIYGTVQIGAQCWFSDNLRVTVYPNNNPITKGNPINGQSFGNTSTANYSCPPNDTGSGQTSGEDCAAASNPLKLGMLYQQKAVLNGANVVTSGPGPRGICPANWHVPSANFANSDLTKLINTVKNIVDCNGKEATCLRVGGKTNFNLPYAGYRMADGWYFQRSDGPRIWTASDNNYSYGGFANFYAASVTLGDSRDMGASVRCVHD